MNRRRFLRMLSAAPVAVPVALMGSAPEAVAGQGVYDPRHADLAAIVKLQRKLSALSADLPRKLIAIISDVRMRSLFPHAT